MTIARRIRSDIEKKIRTGRWKPGHRLPVEHELASRYGCARATVSKAMTALADEGLIKRRKRAGSFVASPRVRSAVLEIPDIPAIVAARGEDYEFSLLSRDIRPLDPDDPDEALLAVGGEALALEGLHQREGRPFVWERRVIALATIAAAANVDFAHNAPGTWLLGHVPWTDARHRITAIAADASLSRRLALGRGNPCLQVERWTWRAGKGVTYATQIFPGDLYHLVSDFSPAS
ncbi:UTRA domain-containing protein [Parasphingopyxis sp.]|uniref:UTRA domain-containing protein n=1 Tax=Parasphingopyxis sp. TaxID=1920299 RepID=UPI00260C3B24|nr:UTRA domain-containing protein [Parasphingopyxis sp.]